ncbi:MAG: MarR family winged helix-turn-helix transcriptional regulator [Acidiferrobacteraceae bacterium]
MATISEEFSRALHESARAWRHALDRRLRPLGLSQAKWLTLLHLAKAGTLTQKELAARLGVEGPTLVGLLDRLSADGWTERQEVPHDRRSKRVRLTERAQPVVEEINCIAAALRAELLAAIPRAELRSCVAVLKQVQTRADALIPSREDVHDA